MPEVFSSAETSLELVNPITDAVIMAIPFLRDDSFSESPNYGPRGYHRSAAVSAARLRSKGTITIRKDAEGMAFAREVERWQKGIIWYPMGSDLKGKRFRHPHIRKVMTQPDGTKEYRTAYDVRLSDRTLSRPDAGILSESFTFEVQGGFDTPPRDRGEPVRALDFHRTGSATYLSPDGLKTAGDGVARFGLPGVVRRNLLSYSDNLSDSWWSKTTATIQEGQAANPLDGRFNAPRLVASPGSGTHIVSRASVNSAGVITGSVYAKKDSHRYIALRVGLTGGTYPVFDLDTGTWVQSPAGFTLSSQALSNGWYRLIVTYTATGTGDFNISVAASSGLAWTASGSEAVYIYGPQVEPGSTATPYQPTNATGPDLTHPLNGAGLVLEGAGTNLCLQSEALDASPWAAGGAGITVTANYGTAPNGTATADRFQTTAGTYGDRRQSITFTAGTTYTLSVWARATSGTSKARLFIVEADGSTSSSSGDLSLTTEWTRVSLTRAMTQTGTGSIRLTSVSDAAAIDVLAWGFQCEASPFPTSYIPTTTTTVTRQPDLCGIVPPHNLLKWSNAFKQAPWSLSAGGSFGATVAAPDDSVTATTITLGAGTSMLQNTGVNFDGKTFTASIWLRVSSGTATVNLGIFNGSGGQEVVCNLTTTWQRFTVKVAVSSGTVRMYLVKPGSSVTLEAFGAQVVEGNHPGVYVPTADTPIPAPVSLALDPAWSQNGAIEYTALLPALSTGKGYGVIGYGSSGSAFGFWRWSGTLANSAALIFDRRHNSATGESGVAGRATNTVTVSSDAFGLSPVRFRHEWTNEINELTGVREMWLRTYQNGVLLNEKDVAALYGATAWATVDPSRMISDGNVNAVISGPSSNPGGVIIEFPRPRAGYRQVDRAA